MRGVEYCPIVGGRCNKNEPEIRVQPDTFFLAEPFKPDEDRKRRESVVKIVLTGELKGKFCDRNLRVADKDPKEAIFCDICRMIQSSAYGIADISGLNPNVLLELGMMFALGRPVTVIYKKSEEESLKEKLPSDIVWKRVIPYEEFIDLHEELGKQVQNRPTMALPISPATEMKKIIAEKDPELAKHIESKLQEILRAKTEEFDRVMEKAKLSGMMSDEKVEIEPSAKASIGEIFEKLKQIEKLVGFPKDAKSAFLKGNWYANKGESEQAIGLYDWALNLKPNFPEALNNKGNTLGSLGKYDEAIKCYDEAIKIKPDLPETWSNKGRTLDSLGKYDEAIKCYDEAIKIKPDDARIHAGIWNNKSEALIVSGKTKEGLESARRALTISMDPQNKAISLLLTSLALRLQGNVKEAESDISTLMDHLKKVGTLAADVEYDFSAIENTIVEKLLNDEKTSMLSIIAFLKGETKSLNTKKEKEEGLTLK
jgi:tetratricopeptide (TPR) repeat protein